MLQPMRRLKTPVFAAIFASSFIAVPAADAAVAYWSFQNTLAGASGSGTTDLTESSGFASAPTVSSNAGTGGNATTGTTTGGVQYTSPVSNSIYAGTTIGTNNTATGQSLTWSTPQTANSSLTGAYFTISLNTTGLTDLAIQFDIRAATAGSSVPAPGAFSLMQYSLNGTDWFSLGATSPTWAHLTSTAWERESLNLSAADAIENQSNVLLRFTFEDSGVNTGAINMNIRLDNLIITAIPEPSSALLASGFPIALLLRRRRSR